MRHAISWLFAAFLALALFVPPIAQAQELDSGDRREIQSTIDRQIAAFKRDDGKEAFSYATPDLQSQFGSIDTFMRMVKAGYGPVYRPRVYQFRELKVMNGAITQQVYVVGPDNIPRLALYFMQEQPDGSWLISGCVLVDFDGDQV